MASNWPPKKNVAFTHYFFVYKNDGTIIANPTLASSAVHVDGNTTEVTDSTLAVVDSTTGLCSIVLAQATMNGDQITGKVVASDSGAVVYTFSILTAANTQDEIVAGTVKAKVDLDTIKTQTVTCGAGVTVLASVGTAATSTAQTGDSYPLLSTELADLIADIGANGSGLTALPDSSGVTTLLSRIVGTLDTGTHKPQSGDAYAVVAHITYGLEALKAILDAAATTDDMKAAVWDHLLTAILTSGSIGKLIKDNLDAAVGTRSTYAGGAVASVTGDVGGNVVGSVGSVTGAVGSVTGAVGSVTGAVGSVGAGGINNASFAADVGSTVYASNIIALAVRKVLDELNLDHWMKVPVANNADMTVEVPDGTVASNMLSATGDTSDYDQSTDSMEAMRNRGDVAWTTAEGFSTHGAADVVTALGTGATLTALGTAANQTTILNRLGGWAGSGVNTVLGAFKAVLSKAASAPSDIGGTFDPATDSLETLSDEIADAQAVLEILKILRANKSIENEAGTAVTYRNAGDTADAGTQSWDEASRTRGEYTPSA